MCGSVVTSSREQALQEHEVRLTNEFALPLHVARFDVPHDVAQHFIVSTLPFAAAFLSFRLRSVDSFFRFRSTKVSVVDPR